MGMWRCCLQGNVTLLLTGECDVVTYMGMWRCYLHGNVTLLLTWECDVATYIGIWRCYLHGNVTLLLTWECDVVTYRGMWRWWHWRGPHPACSTYMGMWRCYLQGNVTLVTLERATPSLFYLHGNVTLLLTWECDVGDIREGHAQPVPGQTLVLSILYWVTHRLLIRLLEPVNLVCHRQATAIFVPFISVETEYKH